jgi:glycosyltransferase involved in cell wall biosynthesis
LSSRAIRIAFVHDWLTGMRGGERALEVLCERFPAAEIFTLVHVRGSVSSAIEDRKIHPSFVQHLPFAASRYREYLPIFPAAIETLDLDQFDVLVSLSHCAAKSVVRPGRARHLCYCLTPMRYAWDQFDAYFGRRRLGPVAHSVMRSAMARLARWDRDTSHRADRYVAISHYVAGRIRRYYNREATVVYPPVDTNFFQPGAGSNERRALIVSALVPYKRIEIGIEACRRARVPLTIVGDGPDRARLEAVADGSVRFVGRLQDSGVRDAYREASVVLLPGEEDFGIVPLEAQACGRPVVALAKGGALETIVSGETGALVTEQTPDAFADAIAATVDATFDRDVIRRHAEQFGREHFGDQMQTIIGELAGEVAAASRPW